MSTAQLPVAPRPANTSPRAQPKETKVRSKRATTSSVAAIAADAPKGKSPKAPRAKASPTKTKSTSAAPAKTASGRAVSQNDPIASDVMRSPAVSCSLSASLNDAVRLMWEHDVGAVVVVNDGNEPIGLITDRDACMASYTQGVALYHGSVWSAMSKTLVSCRFDTPIAEVRSLMAKAQVRRLPVVDAQGGLLGVIGLSDLLTGAPAASSKGRKQASGDPTLVPLLDAILKAPQAHGSSTHA